MDEETFDALLSPDGQRLLARAERADLSDSARLHTLEQLRREAPAPLAAAALDTALLRLRARAKFQHANAMYFTREALEQATAEAVARHRAQRFAGVERVVDLGCGIGGDALALAGVTHVVGVDRDRLRLRMARENARACGVSERSEWVQADIGDGGPVSAPAAFVDPARRTATGRRVFDPAGYDPPLSDVLRWRARFALLAVKVAPGIADEDVAQLGGEVEFVALGHELKEAVLWLGAAFEPQRRATALPSGASIAGTPNAPERCVEAGAVLYEPNPAVIRAHLIGALAESLDAWQIDRTIAYLSADEARPTPFARAWRVEAVLPFGLERVRRHLRALGVGRVTVKKRGSPLEPAAFARSLRLRGTEERTVVLTRQLGRPVALICSAEPLRLSAEDPARA